MKQQGKQFRRWPISHLDDITLTRIDNSGLHAGFPSPAADYSANRINLTKELVPNPEYSELVEVTGDSMIDRGITDPCYVLIDYTLTAVEGDIVYVRIPHQDDTLREYRRVNGEAWLYPRNKYKTYPPMRFTDHEDIEIRGVVIRIFIDPTKFR